jgi:cytochrome c5
MQRSAIMRRFKIFSQPACAWRANGARPVALAVILGIAAPVAHAQSRELTGRQVVEMSCISCHGDGRDGAPRIGDAKAWEKRVPKGASNVAPAVIAGVRKLPAHRGSMDLSDTEIAGAIAYMVNPSGGK